MKLPTLFAFAVAAVLGCSKTSADSSGGSAQAATGKHQVDIIANEKGFTPSSVELKKGEAATLVFKRTTDATCAREVVFPELHVTKELPLNQPVSFDPPVADARTLTFQCGMGMFRGKVIVQ